jgi:hypothetical protein
MPIGKQIADLGDTGDADKKATGFSLSSLSAPAAVTPSFGAASTPAPQTGPTGYAPDRTAGAAEAVKGGADTLVAHNKESEDWINKKWRPVMGWVYMATCTADFVLFPVLWSILQTLQGGQVTSQWQPLTLQGAGLYHIAMGAVLGIAAYGRTKEKLGDKQ